MATEYERMRARQKREAEERKRKADREYRERQAQKRREEEKKEREERQRNREREAERREREEERKEREKEEAISENISEAEEFEETIAILSNPCVKYKAEAANWNEVSRIRDNIYSFAKMYDACGLTEEEAAAKDEEAAAKTDILSEFANDMISGREEACILSMAKLSALDKNPYTAELWKMGMPDSHTAQFILNGAPEDIIPDRKIDVSDTGKHLESAMTKTEYYSLELNYICGCIGMIIRDCFSICPSVENVQVTYTENRVMEETGNKETVPLILCKADRDRCSSIDYDKIETSSFILSLDTEIKFQKTKGLLPIEIKKKNSKKRIKKTEAAAESEIKESETEISEEVLKNSGNGKEEFESITEPSKEAGETKNAVVSVADELIKLKMLMDEGILTKEEFDEQKAILLGKTRTM